MATIIDKLVDFYRTHQEEYSAEHHGEYILIDVNCDIVGFFSSALEAYHIADERGLEPKTFLIRKCLNPDEEEPITFHSRVY